MSIAAAGCNFRCQFCDNWMISQDHEAPGNPFPPEEVVKAGAQRTYDDAMQRQMASGLESRASQTNVSILDAATVPNKPTRPRVALNIALSVVVGILLAMTVVYLLEMFDQRVRWLSDLDSDPQVPLLGVLNKWDGRDGPLLASPYGHPALPRLG